ncbi:MAG: hypothetical protein PHY47_15095 [Lachnospiraceae bacterium]|nr:hypothetical protein [Lachnospiraceae bacterium]
MHELEISESADISLGVITMRDEVGLGSVYAKTPAFSLNRGSYRLEVDHQDDTDSEVVVMLENQEFKTFILPADELYTILEFQLEDSCDHVQIFFQKNNPGTITLKHATFYAQHWFYSDNIFLGVVAILLYFGIYIYACKSGFTSYSDKKKIMVSGCVVLAIVICYPLFNNFLNNAHDLEFHLMRIEGIKDGLRDGQFPVYLYPNNLKGHGYLGSLYPSFFLYIPAVIRMCGVSMVTSYKILITLLQVATMFTSYYCVKKITNSNWAGLAGMILYTLAPYRIINVYMRAALGEALAMVFLPIVLLAIYEMIFGDKKKWFLLVIGLTGIIQSHVLSCFFAGILCASICIVYIKRIFQEKRIWIFVKALAFLAGINMAFIYPFLFYLKSNLKLSILNKFGFSSMSLFPSELFMQVASANGSQDVRTGIGSEMIPMLGGTFILGIIITGTFIMINRRAAEDNDSFVKVLFAIQILFLFATLTWFPWETLQKFSIIDNFVTKIQFPWRFLSIVTIVGSVLIPMVILKYDKLCHHKNLIMIILIMVSAYEAFMIMDSSLTQEIEYTKMSGDFADAPQEEYAPEKMNINDLVRSAYPILNDGAGKVSEYIKKGTKVKFSVKDIAKQSLVEVPLTYYKGYHASMDGRELELMESDSGKVQVTIPVIDGIKEITVQFEQPKEFYVSYIITIFSLILLFLFIKKEKNSKAVKALP